MDALLERLFERHAPNTLPRVLKLLTVIMFLYCRNFCLSQYRCVGKGADRHLFALLNLAKKIHKTSNSQTPFVPPQLYSDPAYSRYHHILVSTRWSDTSLNLRWRLTHAFLLDSNLSTPTLALFGFGATSGDGYGFGYNILADKVIANITSFKNQVFRHLSNVIWH